MLGYPLDRVLMPSLQLLNTLRNQVAHGFDLDRVTVDRFIRLHSDDPDAVANLTDRRRAQEVRPSSETDYG